MKKPLPPEVWLPDPIERCQDGLRRSWLADSKGECWYLSRSAIERFFQEDNAGNDLPEEWRKLLAVANLPADDLGDIPEWLRFKEKDFEELTRWSKELGDKLDLSEEVKPVAAVPSEKRPSTARNNYAFLAVLILLPVIGLYAYMSRLLDQQSAKRLSAERATTSALAALKEKDGRLENEKKGRMAAQDKANALAKQNALLRTQVAIHKDDRPKEIRGIDFGRFTLTRNAGRSTGWDTRSPSFTALKQSPATFTWPKGKTLPATIQVFDEATQKSVWSHPANLSDGTLAGIPNLKAGHYYQWSIVTDSDDEGYMSIPFYILSTDETKRMQNALATAKSDAERAAILAKFGLLDELGSFGLEVKRHLALD